MPIPVMGRLIYHFHCGLLVSPNAQLPWKTLPSSISFRLIAFHHPVLISSLESAPPAGSLSSLLLGPEAGALPSLLPDSKSASSAPGYSLLLQAGSWLQEFLWFNCFAWHASWFFLIRTLICRNILMICMGRKSLFSHFILEKSTGWVSGMLAIICKYAFGVRFRNPNEKSGFL